ncbi:uncharacterized protein LOC131007985 [Salvia miltiorrhiza]|uniref:uncharacterized protein LOC131007985 n=1 Tax=Salvia miltiorrhiza TaxID=226208 RepID=UPI0025ACDD20|nr:uncharacterized protein LOC131007985 [Salvia miltiorrhiza]
MVFQNPKQWTLWLSLAEHWYNTNYHTGIKMSPFEALYGQPPSHPSLLLHYPILDEEAKQFIHTRQQLLQTLKENLQQAQARMKMYANKGRVEREFTVGDWVYLKLQSYRQQSVALPRNLKLAAHYYGPYQVTGRIGSVAYCLALPEGSRIHPVFHISILKKVLSPAVSPSTELPIVDQDGAFIVTPIAIYGERSILRRGRRVQQKLLLKEVENQGY